MRRLVRRWNLKTIWLASMAAAVAVMLAVTDDARPQSPPAPEQRLAVELIRAAIRSASITPISTDALNAACKVGREAVRLDPNNAGLWRLVLDLATLAEQDDLRSQAIERLTVLDPADDHVRLQRVNAALDRYQTVEERDAAYQRLLDEENIKKLGPAAASRIAFDLALLKQRTGDTQEFSRWLTRALELDRSNRSAAAMAAGFVNANVSDPVGQSELLVNLVMADPTDVHTQVLLAQHLLEHGAYAAATRVYAIAGSGLKSSRLQVTSDFMADVAIAQWAAGDAAASLETIDRRQAEIDEQYRIQQARANRTLTMVQIGELKGPIDPTLAAVTAVIRADRGGPEAADAAKAALAAAQQQIKDLAAANPPANAAELATEHLQAAWLALWLADDAAKAAEHVAEADKLQPLSDEARQRFDGWQALKKGETDRAIELLTPAARNNPAGGVGLALALEKAGRAKDAATQLLELNRSQPGTLIGIWASNQLARLLGRRVPLSETATSLERLIASISTTFDRQAADASMAVTLRATLPNENPGAFDPVLVTVSLTNMSSMPLAIDPDGPLRPHVMVLPNLNTGFEVGEPPKPLIIDLDSRLRLMPRETVSQTFDLRWYIAGDMLNAIATGGGIVKLVLNSNVVVDPTGNAMPGLYGQEARAPLLRLDGVRDEPQWLEKAVASLEDPNVAQETLMLNVALLGNELTLLRTANGLGAEHGPILEKARAALPGAFGRLEAPRQAWILAVTHFPAPVEAVIDMARKSESPIVRMSCLLFHLEDANDPMLDAARRSDDPTLRDLANLLAKMTAAAGGSRLPPPSTAPASAPASSPASAPATSPAPAPPPTSAPATTAPAPR